LRGGTQEIDGGSFLHETSEVAMVTAVEAKGIGVGRGGNSQSKGKID
jgi:hypothetical protein